MTRITEREYRKLIAVLQDLDIQFEQGYYYCGDDVVEDRIWIEIPTVVVMK